MVSFLLRLEPARCDASWAMTFCSSPSGMIPFTHIQSGLAASPYFELRAIAIRVSSSWTASEPD